MIGAQRRNSVLLVAVGAMVLAAAPSASAAAPVVQLSPQQLLAVVEAANPVSKGFTGYVDVTRFPKSKPSCSGTGGGFVVAQADNNDGHLHTVSAVIWQYSSVQAAKAFMLSMTRSECGETVRLAHVSGLPAGAVAVASTTSGVAAPARDVFLRRGSAVFDAGMVTPKFFGKRANSMLVQRLKAVARGYAAAVALATGPFRRLDSKQLVNLVGRVHVGGTSVEPARATSSTSAAPCAAAAAHKLPGATIFGRQGHGYLGASVVELASPAAAAAAVASIGHAPCEATVQMLSAAGLPAGAVVFYATAFGHTSEQAAFAVGDAVISLEADAYGAATQSALIKNMRLLVAAYRKAAVAR